MKHTNLMKLILCIIIINQLISGCTIPEKEPDSTASQEAVFISETQIPSPTINPLSLQEDNPSSLIPLNQKKSVVLEDNHIGVHFEDYARYSEEANLVFDNGFKWVRIQSLTDFWSKESDQGPTDLITFKFDSIPSSVDAVINDYLSNDVNIILDLWIGAGLPPRGTSFTTQKEIDLFLDYVRLIVSHFKGRIEWYEIWNEPGDIAVENYANLIKQVAPVIREEDDQAKIIIGSIPGNWEFDFPGYGEYQRFSLEEDYLFGLLKSGVVPLVDGISWHPFYDNIPTDPYYQNYPSLVEKIKRQAIAEGFTGNYFADEFLWRTYSEGGWEGGPPVSKTIATKYYLRAITMNRGLGVNVTINIFFLEGELSPIHNLNVVLTSAIPYDEAVNIEDLPENISFFSFKFPNNDTLISLWNNNEVVAKNIGLKETISLPSFAYHKVKAIDVIEGFSQELISLSENGKLVIPNLIIRDYPIFLLLSRE